MLLVITVSNDYMQECLLFCGVARQSYDFYLLKYYDYVTSYDVCAYLHRLLCFQTAFIALLKWLLFYGFFYCFGLV